MPNKIKPKRVRVKYGVEIRADDDGAFSYRIATKIGTKKETLGEWDAGWPTVEVARSNAELEVQRIISPA